MALDVEVARRLFTIEEYHRMGEAGILGEDERVELIDGEIIEMAPIGTRHLGCVINANRLFITGSATARSSPRRIRSSFGLAPSRSRIWSCSGRWRSRIAESVRRHSTCCSPSRSRTRP
jgi:Uma2 family endonuclease